MKKYRANYTYANSNFDIFNLVENPVNKDFWNLLNDIIKNFEITYPTPLSKYLKDEIGDIAKLHNFSANADDFESISKEEISDELLVTKLLPTAIMRFQILLIELLKNNYLNFESTWTFNILLPDQKELEIFENTTYREEMYGTVQDCGIDALQLAIIDLHSLLNDLLPKSNELLQPDFVINITIKKEEFEPNINAVNINFSLFKKYDEENIKNPYLIYIRTDFGNRQLV